MISPSTVLSFQTEGYLLQLASTSDPLLSKYTIIILDEVHEESVELDLLLRVLYRVRADRRLKSDWAIRFALLIKPGHAFQRRSSLNEAIYESSSFPELSRPRHSGTAFPASPSPFPAKSLEGSTTSRIDGSQHKPAQVAIERIIFNLRQPEGGVILVFADGEKMIWDVIHGLEKEVAKLPPQSISPHNVFPLYRKLSKEEQQMAVKTQVPHGVTLIGGLTLHGKKVILSTNKSETSITIPDVFVVIDTGRAKVMVRIFGMGAESLESELISSDEMIQRRGRAGRTRNGTCEHLYTVEECEQQKIDHPHRLPGIESSDPGQTIARTLLLGLPLISGPNQVPWPNPPSDIYLAAGLKQLIAIDAYNSQSDILRPLGKIIAKYPGKPEVRNSMELGDMRTRS